MTLKKQLRGTRIPLALSVLLLLAITGCAGKAPASLASDAPALSGFSAEPTQSAPELPVINLKGGWPAELVPPELTEYTEGTVVNSGEDGGELYIKIRETNEDALERYLDNLKAAGWIVSGDSSGAEAVCGLYTADFTWQGGGAMLQLVLRTEEAGAWPADKIPPDVLQPQIGTLVGGVEVLQSVEDMWYFNYTYDGIDEKAATKYMQLLMDNGWSGDEMAVSKSFEWKGEAYGATIEIYETVETRTTFTCNFFLGG